MHLSKVPLTSKKCCRACNLVRCAGFCTADVNMDRLPGWEPQSYGYHGDDGNVFRSDGKGRRFGPLFGTGAWAAHACTALKMYFPWWHKPDDPQCMLTAAASVQMCACTACFKGY